MRFFQITLLLAAFSMGSHAQNHSPIQQKVLFHQLSGKGLKAVSAFQWAGEVAGSLKSTVSRGQVLQVDAASLKAAYRADAPAIALQVPTGEFSSVRLKLIRHELFTDDFQVSTSAGEGNVPAYRPGRHYRGIVEGSSRSIAAISIFEDGLMGVIETAEQGNMVLGALEGEGHKGRYILYRTGDVASPPAFECGVSQLEDVTNSLRNLNEHLQAPAGRSGGNCVRVYLECDYDMYLEKGSVQNTIDHIAGLFNVVAAIYQNESVEVVISEAFVWQSPDGYPTNSTSEALKTFRTARPNFNGDLAHLVSRGAPAGGGIAWVDALCSSYSYAYSYIYSGYNELPAYSWSVNVITHEMGHNLGCWHSHDCSWDVNGDGTAAEAIDGCGETAGYPGNGSCPTAPLPNGGGTIMSYCHLVGGVGIDMSKGFGPLPGDKIRFEVSNASCLSACSTCSHTASISKADVRCTGTATGSATATASGGTAPYSFKWSTGATTSSISGLAAGTYSLSVTDASGCLAVESVTINQPTYIVLSASTTAEAAPGADNGAINLTPGGGTPPYTYKWSTGATTQDLYGLSGGIYTVTVTDNNSCTKTASATVTSDGCAAMAGSFPYTESFESGAGQWMQSANDDFDWERGAGPTDTKRTGPEGAADGTFYFYIDASRFSGGAAMLISPCLDIRDLMDPTLSFAYHMYGANMGTLSVQASADNGSNWTTLWMRYGNQGEAWQSATVSLSGYSSGYTKVRFVGTATGGQRGDMAIDAISVDGDAMPCNEPTLNVYSTPASCYGGSDGTATVNASMGVSPYTYAWPNGAPTRTAVGLSAGSYEVTVTDNNGCSATATAFVGQPEEIILAFDVTNVSASGANDGAIALAVSGGTPGYAYQWANGASGPNVSGLPAGAYTVTVTDANGCTQTGSAVVTAGISCQPLAALPYAESFENGFGLWAQSNADGFDWSRGNGGTHTNNTGPSAASDGMYYAYTESTSNNNGTAILEGPCFDLSSAAMPSFRFDYHMYGNQMGTLTLQASTDGGGGWSTIWSRSGQQGRNWQSANISLQGFIGQVVRLRFSSTIGGVRSDMAVDNIGLSDAAALPPVVSTSFLPALRLRLQPNPASSWAAAIIDSPAEQEAELFLADQLGRTHFLGTAALTAGKNEVPLPAAELGQGVYFLIIQTKTTRLIERLLIQR